MGTDDLHSQMFLRTVALCLGYVLELSEEHLKRPSLGLTPKVSNLTDLCGQTILNLLWVF